MMPTPFVGLIAAPFTPFNADCSLKLATIPLIAEHLSKQKLAGALIGGTTGEWASLTCAERRELAEAWRKALGSDLKLIVHVGHNSLADSQDLARHAESIGADAIAALLPSFFRPANIEDAVDYCRLLAAAAPRTPFYYYHMPDMTRVDFKMVEVLSAARQSIPTFRGIKFTHHDLWDYGLTLAKAGEKHDILFGRDEFLLAGLAIGAKGAVGSTYNFAAALDHKMIQFFNTGQRDNAAKLMIYLQQAMSLIVKFGGLNALKAVMGMAGVDCGPVRPPLAQPTKGKLKALRADLEKIDFFSEIKV